MCKRTITIVLFSLFLPFAVFSEIYYWIDKQGVRHYTSSPPEKGEAVGKVNKVATGTYIPEPEPQSQNSSGGGDTTKASIYANQPLPKVVMYTTPGVLACKTAKEWFQKNKIPFTEYDVKANADKMEEYRNLGGSGFPLIMVGIYRLVGWDEKSVREFLAMGP
jgi:hypothetical protein